MSKFQISNFKFQILVLLLLFSVKSAEAQSIFKVDSIPNPPQSIIVEDYKEQASINQANVTANIKHYQSQLSPDVVISFYQQHLPTRGWESLAQESQDVVAMAVFSKGDETVSISAYTLGATTDIYITRSSAPKINYEPQPQGQDVPGKDLAWAPRYPGSIRSLYKEDKRTGTITASYSADANPNEVIAFYRRKMADNGWSFLKDIKLAQLPGMGSGTYVTLLFKGVRGNCQVSVNKPDDFYGIEQTAVLINYVPESAVGRMR